MRKRLEVRHEGLDLFQAMLEPIVAEVATMDEDVSLRDLKPTTYHATPRVPQPRAEQGQHKGERVFVT